MFNIELLKNSILLLYHSPETSIPHHYPENPNHLKLKDKLRTTKY